MEQPRDIVGAQREDPAGRPGFRPEIVREGEPRRDAHAVIVGIDRYEDPRIPNLRYARADAESVYSVLTDPSLGRFDPANVTLLIDEQATEREIRTALGTDLPHRAGREDTVFVYYAGHGAPVIHPKGGSRDGMEKYLVPADAKLHNLRATGIPMEAVQKAFGWIESRQVLFFIDSCYSGVAGGRTFERPDYQPRASLTDEFLEHLGGDGRFVVTACDVNEVSLESPELGHGLFTYYLTEGLKGAADQGGDGLVTVQELYEYIHDQVSVHARQLGGSMHPIQKGSVRGKVFLTRYETQAQRRARALSVEAVARDRAGDLQRARELWSQVVQLQPTNPTAQRSLEDIQRRLDDAEKSRQERLERIHSRLYELYDAGKLPLQEYNFAMEIVSKQPAGSTEVEGKIRHFIELLAEEKISAESYLASIRQARKPRPFSPKDRNSETPSTTAEVHPPDGAAAEWTPEQVREPPGAAAVPDSKGRSGVLPNGADKGAARGQPWQGMRWTIFLFLLVLWLLGVVSSYTLGGSIHILLVVAFAIALLGVIRDR